MVEADINVVLPDEMLRKVFSFLSPPDLKGSMLVCKQWAEIGQAPGLWTWVTFTVDRINMESMPEQMSLKRLQCVTKLDIKAQMVSDELMEAVTIHPGLKRIDINQGFTNLSSVRPELLTKALIKMEDVRLEDASLTPQQLNTLFCSITVDKTSKIQRLYLSGNNLSPIEPQLLAQAVSKLKSAKLFGTLPKFVEHGVAIMDTLQNTCSRTKHLYMDHVDLSAMDADFFGKEVCSKLVSLDLTNVGLSTQQATDLFIGIKEEHNCLKNLWLDFNQLSSVEPFILVEAMTTLSKMGLNSTELTPQQVESIFDALEEPGQLQELYLTGNNLSFVDPAKMTRVNAVQGMTMCHTKLTMKQVISIAEGSIECPKLKWVIEESMNKECAKSARRMYRATNRQFPKLSWIRWTDEELDGTAEEWERLHALFSRAASRGMHIFQDTWCQCVCTCPF